MSLDLIDEKSTLFQVIAWCHQATSQYQSQFWPRPKSPYSTSFERPPPLKDHPERSFWRGSIVQWSRAKGEYKWTPRSEETGFEYLNTLRPRQNGRHFIDDLFRCILMNENISISINISLKVVPKGQIKNIPSMIEIVAWCRPGDKPLSEPMMASSLTHICVTLPQWVEKKAKTGHFSHKLLKWQTMYHTPHVRYLLSKHELFYWKSTHLSQSALDVWPANIEENNSLNAELFWKI